MPAHYDEWLERIQNDLFDVGADISAPPDPERERLRVIPEQTAWLEERCDEVNATLAPLKSFVLPGGTGRPPPTSTSAGRCAGAPSGSRSRPAPRSTPRSSAT